MTKPDEVKKDFRQELTDKFVAALEEGRIPWQRPWNESSTPLSAPINAISEKPYQGGNRLVLTLMQMDKNYADPRWVTFNQAKILGGSVAKGENGTQIEFWREKPFFERKDVDVKLGGAMVKVTGEKDGQVTLAGGRTAPVSAFNIHHDGKEYGWGQAERRLNTLVGQTHTIFNVSQCKDLKIEPLAPKPETLMPMHERGELFLKGMKKDGVRFVEAPNSAFYRSASDTISLPSRDDFKSEALFYGTALHESAHATGNEKRLNRDVGKNEFGSEGYAKEELVAEMTSAFLAAETGIPHDMEDHKAYIQSWAQALKNDKNEIFRAAKLADQAANYMHDRAHEVQLEMTQEKVQEVSKEAELSHETALREIWTAKGISTEKQDELLQGIAAKAMPGAMVGPFKIGSLPGGRNYLPPIFGSLPSHDLAVEFQKEFEAGLKDIQDRRKGGASTNIQVRELNSLVSDSKISGYISEREMKEMYEQIRHASSPSIVIDVNAMLAKDRAAMEAGTRTRISESVMARADRELANGKIDQAAHDRVTETHKKPVMSGMDELSSYEVLMGDYKPSPDSRVYVERGILTIDHNDQKVSFGSAKALENTSVEYGLSNKDMLTADAVQLKQDEAREAEIAKSKDNEGRLDVLETEQEPEMDISR